MIMIPLLGALFVLTVIFKPAFFIVSLFIVLIWFVLARGNGYPALAYLALALSIGFFIGFYPKDHSDPNIALEDQARSLAAPEFNTSNLVVNELSGSRGRDGVYLVAPDQENINKVVLARPSQAKTETYLVSDINQQENGKKIPDYFIGSQVQEAEMLNHFKRNNRQGYAFAFLLALLPLVLISALPRRVKGKEGYIFDTQDAKLKNWLLPKGPSQDTGAITGAAPIQLILVILVAFLIGTFPF